MVEIIINRDEMSVDYYCRYAPTLKKGRCLAIFSG